MKKILISILVLVSIQSFGQMKLYAIRGNLDGTVDSFYTPFIGHGIFNSQGVYIAPTVDSLLQFQGSVFPLSFGSFFKCADQIYRNPIALNGVKALTVSMLADGANLVLTNQANAEQGLGNSSRNAIRLQTNGYTEARLTAVVMVTSASANNPRIYFQYSTDGTNWIGTAPIISLTGTGAKETAWVSLPEGAIGNIYIRVAQNGGDGAADPAVGNITIQFR